MAKRGDATGSGEDGGASVMEPAFGWLATQAWRSAMELGLFYRLAAWPATARALARSAKASPRGVKMVLDAMVGMGQMVRRGDQYDLAPGLRAMLDVPGVHAKTLFADSLGHLSTLMADWSQLTKVIRTGRPVMSAGAGADGDEIWSILARRLFPGNYLRGKELLAKLPARFRRRPTRVLDVAGGSGAWSMPFVEAHADSEGAVMDFAPVLDVARHFARAFKVEDRYAFLPGNIRRRGFGTELYDVVFLGHICHSEGEKRSRRLFQKAHQALKKGGIMLVAEFVVDDERIGRGTGPMPLIFALNMLVHSAEGNTFTLSEYRSWGKEAGFRRMRCIPMSAQSPILLFGK